MYYNKYNAITPFYLLTYLVFRLDTDTNAASRPNGLHSPSSCASALLGHITAISFQQGNEYLGMWRVQVTVSFLYMFRLILKIVYFWTVVQKQFKGIFFPSHGILTVGFDYTKTAKYNSCSQKCTDWLHLWEQEKEKESSLFTFQFVQWLINGHSSQQLCQSHSSWKNLGIYSMCLP